MFALIYLDITIVPTDRQVFYKQIQEHDFDISQPGWQADFDDASNFLDLFRTGGGKQLGPVQQSGIRPDIRRRPERP